MSLKWKTAFLLLITSLVFVTASVEYVLRIESSSSFQKQEAAHYQLLEQLAEIANTAYLTSKNNKTDSTLPLLQNKFTGLVQLPQYQGFYLFQNDTILVAHETGLTLPEDALQQKYIKAIKADATTFLLMVVPLEKPVTEFFILNNNYLFIIFSVVLILTLTGYLIGNRLALKVDELIVGISKAGGGNYSQRISATGNDELYQLAISYNRMLDNMLLATQEMKEQLHNYKCILDTAAEGIVSINERGVIQEYNQSAKRIFGYPAKEIIGKNITKLIPSKIEHKQGELIEQDFITYEAHAEQSSEVIGVRKDEQNFPIELSVSVSTINNTQVYTGIIRDISDRKQRETKQQSLEMQLRTLQRQQTVESLTGGIAHDFNNILGPVLGYADMALTEAEEGTQQHKYLTYILDGAHRARELVSRIMSFTRQYELSREHIHLTNIVESSLDFLKSSLPSEHQIKTFFNTSNDLVAAEETQLTQVLVTMVTNASQAMGTDVGTLTIRLDNITMDEELLARSGRLHSGKYVRMRVQDTGSGMDAMTRASVFEPFFSTRDTDDGSGLGLSVANGIISNFGGDILVDSVEGEGSSFSVFLPVAHEVTEKQEKTALTKPLSVSGELVLYIDDDTVIAEMGRDMLENLGYEVEISVSSEKALQMFRADPEDFDLVITDQSMPVLTGTQLARELKRIRADIPIILVTGFSASILNQELIESGIDHCIAKPVVIDELGEIVLQALAKFK